MLLLLPSVLTAHIHCREHLFLLVTCLTVHCDRLVNRTYPSPGRSTHDKHIYHIIPCDPQGTGLTLCEDHSFQTVLHITCCETPLTPMFQSIILFI